MSAYVSPKESAYCPECHRHPQQERTQNPGERLCSNGHIFTLAESKEALKKDRPRRVIKVGVFPFGKRNARFNAYTTWYNPTWKGCCEHEVEATNGTEAKKLAIAEHKERCL